jgi:transcriptional regulator GlxA family with amidase domain
MHVAMMLYVSFRLLEVTGPMDVFLEANRLCGATLYDLHLVGTSPGPFLCSNGVAVGTTECLVDSHISFDIVVVPGSPVIKPGLGHCERVDRLSDAGRRVRRLASVSNGAFLIARAGLADHRAVTTHWRPKSDATQE